MVSNGVRADLELDTKRRFGNKALTDLRAGSRVAVLCVSIITGDTAGAARQRAPARGLQQVMTLADKRRRGMNLSGGLSANRWGR